MKKITFDEEELFAIAVFNPDTRPNTIQAMKDVLPELKEDQEMFDLLVSAMEKLKRTSDEEYKKMDLETYREEMESAVEEEEREDDPGEEGRQEGQHTEKDPMEEGRQEGQNTEEDE